jgi:hypothetical protein
MDLNLFFIRDFRAGRYLDVFLVATVTAVLGIRFFLTLTGFPRLGGSELHVAHMLWGGLLMLAAMVLLLGFLSHAARMAAAVVGGLGFGTFIDEIGKFLTHDNDYFFRPAVALIYVTCILLYLASRTIHGRRRYTGAEYVVNALQELQEIASGHLDEVERERAQQMLVRSGVRVPLVRALLDALERTAVIAQPAPHLLSRAQDQALALYRNLVHRPGFATAVVLFFLAQLAVKLAYVLALVFLYGWRWEQMVDVRLLGRLAQRFLDLGLIDWLQLSSSLLSGALVLVGVARIRRSRLMAYIWFRRSILVSIFVTQVFAFYTEQFGALVGLALNILVLVALEYLIPLERSTAEQREEDADVLAA